MSKYDDQNVAIKSMHESQNINNIFLLISNKNWNIWTNNKSTNVISNLRMIGNYLWLLLPEITYLIIVFNLMGISNFHS